MYVLMITPNQFPEGDAGAVRDRSFAYIYQNLGYQVFHIGMKKDSKGTLDGIIYTNIYRDNSGIIGHLKKQLLYASDLKMKIADLEGERGKPDLIHIYDIPETGMNYIRKYAEENNITVIHDSVEWYSPSQFKLGIVSYPYLMKLRTNTKLIRKPIRVIAISRFLERYFTGKGLVTRRIPVIMDSNDYVYTPLTDDSIKITYAGKAGKKDYLDICVRAFAKLTPEIRNKFEFDIFGVTDQEIHNALNGFNLPKEIKVYGRVPRQEVLKNLQKSSISILLRPSNETYAQAGFPTKVVECMMNGCIMACNLTSDLDIYLNSDNAFIVKGCDEASMKSTFEQIAQLGREEIEEMRLAARKTAERSFDYRQYISVVDDLIHAER